jgi:hypothetical protein
MGVGVKQAVRSYPGNYKITFPTCFQNFNDEKTINYSNFYLTGEYLFTDIFETSKNTIKSQTILTKIQYGRQFLTFEAVNPDYFVYYGNYKQYKNYGIGVFSSTASDKFYIEFQGYGKCNIYFKKDDLKYYLVADEDNKLFFANERVIPTGTAYTSKPQDFNYTFQSDGNYFLLFKQTDDGSFIVRKEGDILVLKNNIIDYVYDPFRLTRDVYTTQNTTPNFSYIVYNNNNNMVDHTKKMNSLRSNFLIHKKIMDYDNNLHVINLKNHLTQDDTFSTSNNMLSGDTISFYISSFREYTSICDEIDQQESNDLKLNYVFYNQSYVIKPGKNEFVSPESMYPFSQINVNDTKFKQSGSFSFTSPKYADKIYRVSDDPILSKDNQHLLCTWLSGSPGGTEAIWVDRYYYPDLIEKEAALVAKTFTDKTYDEFLENIIENNNDLKNLLKDIKVIDKRSDLYFEADTTYIYERFSPEFVGSETPEGIPCSVLNSVYPQNYFKEINKSGKFTLTFDFWGGNDNWVIESGTNNIKSRIQIRKTGLRLHFMYAIFNPVTERLEEYPISATIKKLKKNIFSFSIDSISGEAYLFLNNDIIYSFNISPYKYTRWKVLYGDIAIFDKGIKTELVKYQGDLVSNVVLNTEYTPKDEAYILPLQRGLITIDDITLTLPCGMRNNIDQIDILQDVCNSSTYMSNNVDVLVKNIDTTQIDTDKLKSYLEESINDIVPTNTKVRSIKFKQFK